MVGRKTIWHIHPSTGLFRRAPLSLWGFPPVILYAAQLQWLYSNGCTSQAQTHQGKINQSDVPTVPYKVCVTFLSHISIST